MEGVQPRLSSVGLPHHSTLNPYAGESKAATGLTEQLWGQICRELVRLLTCWARKMRFQGEWAEDGTKRYGREREDGHVDIIPPLIVDSKSRFEKQSPKE